MRKSIRWKLFGSYLLLVTVMGGAFYAILSTTLDVHLMDGVTDNLTSETGIAALAVAQGVGNIRHTAPALASEIGKRTRARVTVIAPDGSVLGDSEVPADRLHEIESHSGRPEFMQAVKEGVGSSNRYSTTLNSDMLYVAHSVQFPEGTGAVRLALPLKSIVQLKSNLHTTLGVALVIAALISLAMSTELSRRVYRPLRQISEFATEIGMGSYQRRLPVQRDDEFGSLARAMNGMAEQIQDQITFLAAERNRLDAILHGMGEGLMVAARDGTISLVNPAFCSLFNIREEVSGRPLIDISRHPALNELFRRAVKTGSELSEEITIHNDQGRTVVTHWVPLAAVDGELQGIVAVFHDITEQKRLEQIRRDFVANVSHELRTPVSVIKGYSETLLKGGVTDDPERAVSFINIILSHSERLALLINDLLALSEMESGGFTLALRPIPLAIVLRHAVELLTLKAEEKGIQLKIAAGGDDTVILADRDRLEQVFINLLDNAVKYTPIGGRVMIDILDGDKTVTVRVADNGPGIPAHNLPRIFERFYRVDASRSRAQGGTGLGLAIVKHIVQLHGGSVTVESIPGQGAVFSVTLKKPE